MSEDGMPREINVWNRFVEVVRKLVMPKFVKKHEYDFGVPWPSFADWIRHNRKYLK
jgi:hypothetical protein